MRRVLRSLEKPDTDPTYLEFFGLTRPPFSRLIETAQLFHCEQYSLLMQHLANATQHNDSCVVVCGANGSGKSTLLDHFIGGLDDHTYFVAINETCRGEANFYSEFLTQIGFLEIDGTAAELQNITKEFLVYRGNAGNPVLLIIDNAHLIDPIILEQLRQIAAIEVNGRRVLSLVLAGNANLVRVIDAPAMSQTRFYHHVVFNIRNYSEEETASYVWHRLNLAGGNDGVKIANEAHPVIHRYSGGIPHLINTICDDMLTEAFGLKSRVISEKIVRAAATKQGLMPHVVPLHGRGRRKTDPDYERVAEVPKTDKGDAKGEPSAMAAKDLPRLVSQLTEQLADLRADKLRALKEIAARNEDIGALRNELNAQTAELEALTHSLVVDGGELGQSGQALSDRSKALQDDSAALKELASELEKEQRTRKAAEKELEQLRASGDERAHREREFEATIHNLQAELESADDRAAGLEKLEKATAELKGELDSKSQELNALQEDLAARSEALAKLEAQLAESQEDCAAAYRRIEVLKDPEDLNEIAKRADQLAASLEDEKHSRTAAENELAAVAATLDEFAKKDETLRATVAELESARAAAEERATDFESLEESTTLLQKNFEELSEEVNSLREQLTLRDENIAHLGQQLEQSESACRIAQQRLLELKSPKELEEMAAVHSRVVGDLEKERSAREAAEQELETASSTVEELDNLKQDLQSTIDNLQAQIMTADERVAELEALVSGSAALEEEVGAKSEELASLREQLEHREKDFVKLEKQLAESDAACAAAESRIAILKDPEDLQEIEKLSDRLAGELDEEQRAREAAETDLASAVAKVDDLQQAKAALQDTVLDLEARLQVADERAVGFDAAEKAAAGLEDEIAQRSSELDSLQQELAAKDEAVRELDTLREELAARDEALVALDSLQKEVSAKDEAIAALQAELDDAQKDVESAQSRIAVLKDPEDLQAAERRSDEVAAELVEERRAREAAEAKLAKVSAKVDELVELKEGWRATIEDLESDLKAAEEKAAEFDVLERSNAALKELVEEKTDELDALRDRLAAGGADAGGHEQHAMDLQASRKTKKRGAAAVELIGNLTKDGKKSTSDSTIYPSHVVEMFEQSVSDIPAYQALKKFDSRFYDKLVAKYKQLIAQDLTDKQVNDALRAKQARLVEKLLPRASDDAIVAYARSIVDQLDEFDQSNTEPSYELLVPVGKPGKGEPPALSEKSRNAELAVLEKTLKTYDANTRIPREATVWPDLEPIFAELFQIYGEENVSALQHLEDPGNDRKLVCRISRALYAKVLELPKRRAAKALRWLLHS